MAATPSPSPRDRSPVKDFGNYQHAQDTTNATISGIKFEDKNHNGHQDSYEEGLAGWEIRAYVDANHNHKLDTNEYKAGWAARTYTDDDGSYTLSLKPGAYVLVEVLQKDFIQTGRVTSSWPMTSTRGLSIWASSATASS